MRGVHVAAHFFFTAVKGSSPHARGPQGFHDLCCVVQGIIPACAGSTLVGRGEIKVKQDHPRMRGVHAVGSSLISAKIGSSPHARGPLFPEFKV